MRFMTNRRRTYLVCTQPSNERVLGKQRSLQRVLRALDGARRSADHSGDPIVEQLRQCPEAFKVGEILGKAFDSLKYRQEEVIDGDRILSPPGTIIPPFV
jgi:hypothetical protein